jgi:IclR family acetate operon transcriptional repressor
LRSGKPFLEYRSGDQNNQRKNKAAVSRDYTQKCSGIKNTSALPAPAYPIESVAKALQLLLEFQERPAIRVADAGRALGVARSTAHRLLAMLAHFGFVVQDEGTRAYRVGPSLVALGTAVTANEDIRSAVRPQLENLASMFGETVHVCTLRGVDVVFLSGIESSKALRAGNRSGTALPAHTTAGGKALLAALDDAAVRARYPHEGLPTLTPRTIDSRSALLQELQQIRERGFAVNNAESEPGLTALGCVVYSGSGDPRGAITMSGPEARMRNADRTRMVAALRNACDAVRATIR